MQIKTSRHYLDFMCKVLMNYFPMLHKSIYRNVARCNKTSAEYLQARLFICVLEEVELILKKKQLTISKEMKIKFSDAQGIILYKTILDMGLHPDHVYGNLVRSSWINQLDQQIIYDTINYHEIYTDPIQED